MYGFPISKGTGFIVLGFGIVTVLYGCFQKISSKQNELSFSICPNCKKSLYSADVPEGLCPICKVRLENLSGFYERHPELRDD